MEFLMLGDFKAVKIIENFPHSGLLIFHRTCPDLRLTGDKLKMHLPGFLSTKVSLFKAVRQEYVERFSSSFLNPGFQ